MSYLITSNLLYYHDGDKWVTRDWATIMERWSHRDRNRASERSMPAVSGR